MNTSKPTSMWRSLPRVTACLMALFITGCASLPERHALPLELTNKAGIPGIPEARFWADEWPKFSIKRLETFKNEDYQRNYPGIYKKPHNYLAISGGGANGAFGAGLFAGWTASGTRPEFTMVTGISTGALTAPFAFLGSDYDDILKEVYTTTSTKDIAINRNIFAAALSDSMADTEPLKKLIAKLITNELIDKIVKEHKRGRRLFVGTVNLDAGRSVIWNIGAIAASDSPRKLELIREVLRASAAIPVAFPPVVISVEVNGKHYDEMHVDGGTGTQVFVYPAAVDWRKITKKLKVKGKPKVYVIRNSFLDPDYRGVKRSVLPIASRSIDSLIRTQGIGDLYQIYALSKRDGNDFNLAYIPSTFTEIPTEGFDPVYMKKLYKLGYESAINGYQWKKEPPGFKLK
ncbi:MAG TPA: patatin [Gammaproteobacteria bacterium]|nr:patatin [Gammaproteobacteria bacterium]